ncbi:hypothetical protein [Streptomyces sp. NPDC059008]|uniref:hypothetical protein n=1 Tax=Streptomyces sp. NPDC059008 TaxID=3346693 RepID=UPI0036C68E0F
MTSMKIKITTLLLTFITATVPPAVFMSPAADAVQRSTPLHGGVDRRDINPVYEFLDDGKPCDGYSEDTSYSQNVHVANMGNDSVYVFAYKDPKWEVVDKTVDLAVSVGVAVASIVSGVNAVNGAAKLVSSAVDAVRAGRKISDLLELIKGIVKLVKSLRAAAIKAVAVGEKNERLKEAKDVEGRVAGFMAERAIKLQPLYCVNVFNEKLKDNFFNVSHWASFLGANIVNLLIVRRGDDSEGVEYKHFHSGGDDSWIILQEGIVKADRGALTQAGERNDHCKFKSDDDIDSVEDCNDPIDPNLIITVPPDD